jgi:uncharacterized protein GlcG (DUF336 family)
MIRTLPALALLMAGLGGAGAQAQSSAAKPSPFQDQKTLTGTAARAMVDACRAYALAHNMQVTIVVLDAHGDVLDMHRMDGAHMQAFRTAPLKAKTALVNRLPTTTVAERVAQGNATPIWLGDFPQRGGVPILLDGKAVGAIGVGGGRDTQDEDCAQAAIDAVMKTP